MNTTTLEPFGVAVSGVRLPDLGPGGVEHVRDLLADHGFVVWHDQDLDDASFVAFLGRFGPLAFTRGETPLEGFPDLNEVSNVGRSTPPRSSFHVDTSYVRRPPAYTALRAVTIPAVGGGTVFADQYRALQTLPSALRERLEGRSLTHVATGVDLGPGDEAAADHLLLRPHPRTGRLALYLSAPTRCAAISGMDGHETSETVAVLLEHSTRPDNLHHHAWTVGDVVMWDNACVLHRADHGGVVGDRVLHRGMVASHHGTGR